MGRKSGLRCHSVKVSWLPPGMPSPALLSPRNTLDTSAVPTNQIWSPGWLLWFVLSSLAATSAGFLLKE